MSLPLAAVGISQLMMASQAASAVAGVAGAISKYGADKRFAEQNSQAAVDAQIAEFQMLNDRRRQEKEAASQSNADATIKSLKASSSTLAAAAAGGVQGGSVAAGLADFRRSLGIHQSRTQANLEAVDDQIDAEARGAVATAKNRIASAPMPNAGEVWGSVIRGAGALAGSYYDFKNQTNEGMRG